MSKFTDTYSDALPFNWAPKILTGKNAIGTNKDAMLTLGGGGGDEKNPYNPYGIPYAPYTQGYNPSTDARGRQFEQNLAPIGNEYIKEANRTGPSAYSMLRQGEGARNVAAQSAMERANLAAGRGLSSGAAERAGDRATQNLLQSNESIRASDAANRMGMQGKAVDIGLDKAKLGELGYERDTQNKMAEAGNINRYNLGLYQNMAGLQGAQAQAYATEHAGKK